MNRRRHLKQKRAHWLQMARANCNLFGLPRKSYLTWQELPQDIRQQYPFQDVLYHVRHFGVGVMRIDPMLQESDFTPVTKEPT